MSNTSIRLCAHAETYKFSRRRWYRDVLDDHRGPKTITTLSDHRTKRADDEQHDGYASTAKNNIIDRKSKIKFECVFYCDSFSSVKTVGSMIQHVLSFVRESRAGGRGCDRRMYNVSTMFRLCTMYGVQRTQRVARATNGTVTFHRSQIVWPQTFYRLCAGQKHVRVKIQSLKHTKRTVQ